MENLKYKKYKLDEDNEVWINKEAIVIVDKFDYKIRIKRGVLKTINNCVNKYDTALAKKEGE